MQLILSLFPGVDLLGMGFEQEGFCVVRAPDLIFGGDIKSFHIPARRFNGIIGGSPCQDFSTKRRAAPTGYGVAMLREFLRVVSEGEPDWFLLENVATVPDIEAAGYSIQRIDLNARECGMRQSRLRHFQFGSRAGIIITPERQKPRGQPEPICLASEGTQHARRSFADFCELQGLPRSFALPGWTVAAKYAAVGNGVPPPMARVIARAIRTAKLRAADARLCACRCGRVLEGRQKTATPACRKRLQRRRSNVTRPLSAAPTPSQVL
jgi:DNA (cytosine-5)-methyltransferase 1